MISYLLTLLLFLNFANGAESSASFRLSMTDLPKSLDPHRLRTSSGSFLIHQLYRNFYTYDDKKSYVPELGNTCVKKKLKWTCTLKPGLQWSDGSPLTPEDFVLSLRRILTLPSPRAELLFNILNAREVFEEKKNSSELGVKVIDSKNFEITWISESPDNELVLTSPLFAPVPRGQFKNNVFSGPYQLSDQTNQRILLSPNRVYFKKNSRPVVEFQIFEENLSVKAYEKGQLDFLRRVPSAQIANLEKNPDFHWYPVLRFDSISFGPDLQKDFELRKKLVESLNFEELQKLFNSPGKIGCPGLSTNLLPEICYKGNQTFNPLKKSKIIGFAYSTAGGDDHRRLSEWLQSEWLKKLNVNLSLQPYENKIFQDLLEKKPPEIYRRGLNLEVPSCYYVAQIFTSDHPDNFIQFKNRKYDELVFKLKLSSSSKTQKTLCSQAFKILMDAYVLIPTGRIHSAIQVNPNWTGWRLNELNHLDLSELEFVAPAAPKATKK